MNRVAVLGCFFLLGCDGSPDQAAKDVRTVIERHNADLEKWYASGEIDSVAAVFTEDAWQMPPNSPPLVGREAIRAYWSEAVTWGEWAFELETTHVEVSGPIAVERGKYTLTFFPGEKAPNGMNAFEDRGNYLVHWRLEDDGAWRIAGDAPVSEVPLPR